MKTNLNLNEREKILYYLTQEKQNQVHLISQNYLLNIPFRLQSNFFWCGIPIHHFSAGNAFKIGKGFVVLDQSGKEER